MELKGSAVHVVMGVKWEILEDLIAAVKRLVTNSSAEVGPFPLQGFVLRTLLLDVSM